MLCPISALKNILLIFLCMFLVACGGGGGGADSDTELMGGSDTGSSALGSGSVGLVVTDAPSDDFDHIYLTITSVLLLGNDSAGQVEVFSGEETIDILALENFAEFFALSDDVPEGNYSKLRLMLSNIELIKLDDDENITEAFSPELPANGKIDLLVRGGFTVGADQLLTLELDVDAEKSIHIVGTGNNRYKFRPVIFINVVGEDDTGKLLRVSGVIDSIDALESTLIVCSQRGVATDQNEDVDRGCVDVSSVVDIGVFDEAAMPIDFGDLEIGDSVLVIGRYLEDDDESFDVLAEVIQRGGAGTSGRYHGITRSDFDSSNSHFEFEIDSGQGFSPMTAIAVSVESGTAIFSGQGVRVAADSIEENTQAQVEGVIDLSNSTDDVLRAIAVLLDSDDLSEDSLEGDILSIDTENRELMVDTESGDRCVNLDNNIEVFTISDEDGLEAQMIEIGGLVIGDEIDIFGEEDENSGCFIATTIIVDRTDNDDDDG